MMLFKLSARNIRKSIQNYLIYFATLILGVAIFYVFNALGTQTVMLRVSDDTRDIIKLMMDALSVISVFVSFVLGFLIVYASSFLMKRRKREFGIYMLLGMSKRKISMILILETIMIGLISLAIGLLLGVVASQGMSILVAAMFEADMTSFTFVVSKEAIVKTLLYFMVMYVIVIALDAFVVGKSKLIHLINSQKHMQKNHAKNPILCVLVFIVACVLLGTAYYNVTAGVTELAQLKDLAIQIVKGIIGTLLVFWSVSGLLLTVVKGNKKFYYKGLNCFGTKELSSRINTTVLSGSIICLLLFFTICILSSAVAVKTSLNRVLEEKVPMDVQFLMYSHVDTKSIPEHFEEYGVDQSVLKDTVCVRSYQGEGLTWGMLLRQVKDGTYTENVWKNADEMFMEVIKLSDYNRQAEAFHMEQFTLAEDEYLVIVDYSETKKDLDKCMKVGAVIEIAGKEYRPKYNTSKKAYLAMSNAEDNTGVVILPDSADLSEFNNIKEYYTANYVSNDETERERLDKYFSRDSEFYDLVNPDDKDHGFISSYTKTALYTSSIGLAAMIIFIGIYLGVVFLISGAAILALKELSEAADSREKYQVLRRIGVDEKQISKTLFLQCGIFFGLPLLLAAIHSVFGMQTAMFLLSGFGKGGLGTSILLSAGIILGIYGIYFWITYVCSRKIISE